MPQNGSATRPWIYAGKSPRTKIAQLWAICSSTWLALSIWTSCSFKLCLSPHSPTMNNCNNKTKENLQGKRQPPPALNGNKYHSCCSPASLLISNSLQGLHSTTDWACQRRQQSTSLLIRFHFEKHHILPLVSWETIVWIFQAEPQHLFTFPRQSGQELSFYSMASEGKGMSTAHLAAPHPLCNQQSWACRPANDK